MITASQPKKGKKEKVARENLLQGLLNEDDG